MNNSWFPWTATAPGTLTTFGSAAPNGLAITRLTADGSRLVTNAAGVMGYYTWNGTTYANFTTINLPNLTNNSFIGIAPDGSYIFYCGDNRASPNLYFAFWNGSTYANETLNVCSGWNSLVATYAVADFREFCVGYNNVVYFSYYGDEGRRSYLIALGYNNATGYFDKFFNLANTDAMIGGVSVPRLSATGKLYWDYNGTMNQPSGFTIT